MFRARFNLLFCIALIAVGLASCGGGGGGGNGMPDNGVPAVAASKIFVGDSAHGAIGSSPNSNPSPGTLTVDRTIIGPNTLIDTSLFDFVLDVANDRLYVADLRSILVFNNASTATGNVAPSRIVTTIPGGLGGFNGGIALDTTRNIIYGGTNLNTATQDIQVFDNASTATSAAPNRLITFTTSGIADLVVDTSRDVLYVLNVDAGGFYRISVFTGASTLNSLTSGPVTPVRTIALNAPTSAGAVGIFIDAANDRLYAPILGKVVVFDGASTANGSLGTTITATRTINLPVVDFSAIFVELTANRLYATDSNGVSIIANASSVDNSQPFTVTRVLAPAGATFKAVAVKP